MEDLNLNSQAEIAKVLNTRLTQAFETEKVIFSHANRPTLATTAVMAIRDTIIEMIVSERVRKFIVRNPYGCAIEINGCLLTDQIGHMKVALELFGKNPDEFNQLVFRDLDKSLTQSFVGFYDEKKITIITQYLDEKSLAVVFASPANAAFEKTVIAQKTGAKPHNAAQTPESIITPEEEEALLAPLPSATKSQPIDDGPSDIHEPWMSTKR